MARTTSRAAALPRNRRPAQRAVGTRTPAAAKQIPTRFTGRMALLVVVAAVLVVSYASSMRAYLQQRSHIAGLKAEIANSKRDIRDLQRQKDRWQDPAYVETQARQRLGWVLPGETAYQVVDGHGRPLQGQDGLGGAKKVGVGVREAWWGKAYGSLQEADHPASKPKPAPVRRISGQ